MLTGVVAMMLMLGLALQPVWADEGSGYKMGYGRSHGESGHGAHAGQAHHGGTGHYLRHLLKHQKEIGLTDEQVTRLKALSLDLDRTRIKTEAEIQIAERELAALVHDDKSDLSAIEAKVTQSESLEAGLRIAAIKAKREAWALLTPEQRDREKTEHEKMLGRHREG
jgi:Spy/CpxP family protein refolding chaperone